MMTTTQAHPDLFDICAYRHRGNPESLAARETTNADRDRMRILTAIQRADEYGITCDELEQSLGMSHQTCSARCSDLKREGMIVASDRRRNTRTGCAAAVLVVKESAI